MAWPTIENEPLHVNLYQISNLVIIAFPTLFPNGNDDPTNKALLRDVPLHEIIKHILKFPEIINYKWGVPHFPNHPRFSHWTFNMIHRKRILQQSVIFLKRNPGEPSYPKCQGTGILPILVVQMLIGIM